MSWLKLPDVKAPGLDRKATVTYRISPEFVQKNTNINRATPVMQLWAHVVGQLPPINNIGRLATGKPVPTTTTLHQSVALFQGLNRPHDDEKDGDSVLVYVVNPAVTIAYQTDMVCVARAVPLPKNTVLTVQVRLKHPLLQEDSQLDGVITRLEFVSSDPLDSHGAGRSWNSIREAHLAGYETMTQLDTPQRTAGGYIPAAVYFEDSDCVEYVREDNFVIYHRIDDFLTLIYDETKIIPVGFKLKGFKHVFNAHLKSLFELNDKQFLSLVAAIEAVCSEIGDELFADDERTRAYKAARKLAANDNVQLHGSQLSKKAA